MFCFTVKEVLIIADEILELLELKSFELFVLKPPATWEHLLSQLSSGNMSVLNFRVIVLFLGRSDIAKTHAEVESWLDKIIATIRAINADATIVLSAVLKFPQDTEDLKVGLKARNRFLEVRASESRNMKYFNGNLSLVKYGQDKPVFKGSRCSLTGVIILGKALRNWLRATKLLYHYHTFKRLDSL